MSRLLLCTALSVVLSAALAAVTVAQNQSGAHKQSDTVLKENQDGESTRPRLLTFLGRLWSKLPRILVYLPAFLFAEWAASRFKDTFDRYQQIVSKSGCTGYTAAERLLAQASVTQVKIVRQQGEDAFDHYSPFDKELALTDKVYEGRSLSAIAIAAHEVGHALQHASHYWVFWVSIVLAFLTRICWVLGIVVSLAGLFLAPHLLWYGLYVFAGSVVFPVIELPVEFDASRRAKQLGLGAGLIQHSEQKPIEELLRAAAYTYVASSVKAWYLFLVIFISASLRA